MTVYIGTINPGDAPGCHPCRFNGEDGCDLCEKTNTPDPEFVVDGFDVICKSCQEREQK